MAFKFDPSPSGIIITSVCTIIFIGLVFYINTEYNYQQRINTLKNEVNKVWQDVVRPAGGVERGLIEVEAPFWFTSFCIDNGPCPTAGTDWFVLADSSQRTEFEAAYIKNLLQKTGYQGTVDVMKLNDPEAPGPSVYGHKGKLNLHAGFYHLYQDDKPPYPAPAGKEWRLLGVYTY